MNEITKKIQAYLLFHGGSVSRKNIYSTLKISDAQLDAAIAEIKDIFSDTGLTLIDNGVKIAIATNPSMDSVLSDIKKSEYETQLSRSAREILSLIAYAGPISKQDIDFLRAVNSQFSLRKLILRGLIADEEKLDNRREKQYRITNDFLTHMGVSSVEELPDYEEFRSKILESLKEIKTRIMEN